MKKIIIILIAIIQIAYFSFWFSCLRLADFYYFSAFNLKLRLDDTARYDTYQPHLIAKIFNNKVSGFVTEIYSTLLHYFDSSFLIQFFSFVGCVGIAFGLYFLWKNSRIKVLALFAGVTFLSLLTIFIPANAFYVPFIIIFMTTGLALSLYGVKNALDSIPRLTPIFVLLLALSAWWFFVFGLNVIQFCIAK